MENKKKRTTIVFDADNWVKFQNIAAMQNTSPTQLLNELVASYVSNKLPENYQQRIQEKVFETLDKQIDKAQLEIIADRVFEIFWTRNLSIDTIETVPTLPIEGITVPELNQELKDKTNATNTTSATKANVTNTTKATKLTKEEKIKKNLAKFRRYQASDNRKSYKDGDVAPQEGVTSKTINRYRIGIRSPGQGFIDRWGLSWDGKGWIKNLEDRQNGKV